MNYRRSTLFFRPPRPIRLLVGLATFSALLAAFVSGGRCRAGEAAPPAKDRAANQAESPKARSGAPLMLDDVPGLLRPKATRTEEEQDRLEAVALFAAGHSLERSGEEAEALRLYQRALRWDPQSVEVVRSIIPLAFRLKRHAEAVRYALKAAELEDADPLLLRRLGVYLTEEGNYPEALKLYERALTAQQGAKEDSRDLVLLRMEMGRLYHLVEQYPKAADCFAQVVRVLEQPKGSALDEKVRKLLLGEPGLTYNLFGESFLLADRPQEAVAAFEKAQQLAPNQGLLQLNLARVYARTGKPEQALAALAECLAEKPAGQFAAPYELLAEVLDKLGKKEELLGRLEKLHADSPEDLPLSGFLARQYRRAEQFPKAESLYRELLQKSASLAEAKGDSLYRELLRKNITLTSYRGLAEIFRKSKQIDALLAILGEAVEKTGVLQTFGAEAQTITGDADLVGSLLEAARTKLKDRPETLDYGTCLAAALLALEAKQFQAADALFEAAIKAKPEQIGELLVIWGVGLLVGERPAEAAKVFQRGIDEKALPEDDSLLYFYLAGALESDNRTEEALAAARKAAEAKPDDVRFQSREAWVLDHAKRHDEAAKAYAGVIEQFDADYASPETREMLRLARLSLSNIYVIKEQLPQAEQWLEQVLDEFPDDANANNDLGYLWADQGKHLKRTLKMVQLAVQSEPENVAYHDSLGWVFYRLKRYPEAVAELEKAAAGKDEGVILDHLGDAYLKVHEPQKATDAWRRAAKAFEKENETAKAKQVKKKIKS